MKRFASSGGILAAIALAALGTAAEPSSWELQVERMIEQGRLDEAERMASLAAEEPATAGVGYEWLGRVAMAGARHEEAALQFERAREFGGDSGRFASVWATALVKLGRRPEACAVLGEASLGAASDANLRHRAGACYLRLDDAKRALPHLEAAYGNGLRHAAVVMDLARALLARGREDRGVELLEGVTATDANPETLLAVGRMLFRAVLYRQALLPLRRAWEAKPGWYDAGMYLALAHYQLEEYAAGAEVLAKLDADSASAEYRCLAGSVQGQLGNRAQARRELERCIQIAPDRADGYLNLGLFFLDHGQTAEALEALEQGATRSTRGAKVFYRVASRANCRGLAPPAPRAGGDVPSAEPYLDFADSLLRGQQWGSALAVYLAAVDIDPGSARPYGGIGLICQELGTAEVGVEFVKRGLELHPGDAELHYFLGSLLEYLARPQEAIRSYEAALRAGAGKELPARYWLRLGLAQVAAGRLQAAEASYRTALQREPDSGEGHYRLGKLRFSAGRYAEAETLFGQAVQLDPSLAEAYYAWGLACVRNGKADQGREILESHRRKLALRQAQAGGMQ